MSMKGSKLNGMKTKWPNLGMRSESTHGCSVVVFFLFGNLQCQKAAHSKTFLVF